jgi:hypothetical protein
MNIATEEFVTRQLASDFSNNFFALSASRVKNGEERLVVLNRVARSVIDSRRGKHPDIVFVREFKKSERRPVRGMNNTA